MDNDDQHLLRIPDILELAAEDQLQQREQTKANKKAYNKTYNKTYRRNKRVEKKAQAIVQDIMNSDDDSSKTPGGKKDAHDAFQELMNAKSTSKKNRQKNTEMLAKKFSKGDEILAKKIAQDEQKDEEDDAALLQAFNWLGKYMYYYY